MLQNSLPSVQRKLLGHSDRMCVHIDHALNPALVFHSQNTCPPHSLDQPHLFLPCLHLVSSFYLGFGSLTGSTLLSPMQVLPVPPFLGLPHTYLNHASSFLEPFPSHLIRALVPQVLPVPPFLGLPHLLLFCLPHLVSESVVNVVSPDDALFLSAPHPDPVTPAIPPVSGDRGKRVVLGVH